MPKRSPLKDAIRADRSRPLATGEREALAQQLKGLAWLLDNSIKIPGINYRIGIDGLIGLIPVAGDTVTTLLSSYIIAQAARAGAPRLVLLRMAGNVLIDTLVGMIPLFGDLFDFAYKSNRRNVDLLSRYLDNPQATSRSSGLTVVLLILFLLAMLAASIFVAVLAARGLWNLVSGGGA